MVNKYIYILLLFLSVGVSGCDDTHEEILYCSLQQNYQLEYDKDKLTIHTVSFANDSEVKRSSVFQKRNGEYFGERGIPFLSVLHDTMYIDTTNIYVNRTSFRKISDDCYSTEFSWYYGDAKGFLKTSVWFYDKNYHIFKMEKPLCVKYERNALTPKTHKNSLSSPTLSLRVKYRPDAIMICYNKNGEDKIDTFVKKKNEYYDQKSGILRLSALKYPREINFKENGADVFNVIEKVDSNMFQSTIGESSCKRIADYPADMRNYYQIVYDKDYHISSIEMVTNVCFKNQN